MNLFLPGNNGADPERLQKAALYLKQLTVKWRMPILKLYLLRTAQFLSNMCLIVMIAHVIAELVLQNKNAGLLSAAAGIGMLMLSKVVLTYLSDRVTATFTARILETVRNTLFYELEDQLDSPLINHSTGTLALTFGEKTESLPPYFTRYLPQMLLSVTAPVVLVSYILWLNWVCGAMMILTLPLIPVYMVLTGKGTAEAAREQWQALSKMGNYFYDRLKGVTTLFVYGQLESEVKNVEQASESYENSAFSVLKIAFLSAAVLEFFSTIIVAGVAIYIGLSLINYIHWGSAGNFTLEESLVILMLVPDFLSALKTLGTYYHDRSMALGAILNFHDEGFLYRIVTESKKRDKEKSSIKNNEYHHPLSIVIDNLGFWHPGMPLLFKGLNMQVEPGEKLIIRGRNGSGKSTLFSLLLGFISPIYGSVLLGGRATEKFSKQEISNHISWTGQHPKIFNGTLRSNLLMGLIIDDANILRIIAEYFDTNLFFLAFSDGLDTIIAENGRSISGGERQKVALLRAMLKNAGIILLDEPFANLDRAATARFMEALIKNKRDQTIILILHDEKVDYNGFKTININERLEEYSNLL